jgi:hypothetical protein
MVTILVRFHASLAFHSKVVIWSCFFAFTLFNVAIIASKVLVGGKNINEESTFLLNMLINLLYPVEIILTILFQFGILQLHLIYASLQNSSEYQRSVIK